MLEGSGETSGVSGVSGVRRKRENLLISGISGVSGVTRERVTRGKVRGTEGKALGNRPWLGRRDRGARGGNNKMMEQQPRRRLHYSELNVWQKASEFSAKVTEETRSSLFNRHLNLRDQLNRSALSIHSNIAEGEGQSTNKGSIKFYFIARGSLNEARSQLRESFVRGCITQDKLKLLDALAEDVARLIAGVLRARRAREN